MAGILQICDQGDQGDQGGQGSKKITLSIGGGKASCIISLDQTVLASLLAGVGWVQQDEHEALKGEHAATTARLQEAESRSTGLASVIERVTTSLGEANAKIADLTRENEHLSEQVRQHKALPDLIDQQIIHAQQAIDELKRVRRSAEQPHQDEQPKAKRMRTQEAHTDANNATRAEDTQAAAKAPDDMLAATEVASNASQAVAMTLGDTPAVPEPTPINASQSASSHTKPVSAAIEPVSPIVADGSSTPRRDDDEAVDAVHQLDGGSAEVAGVAPPVDPNDARHGDDSPSGTDDDIAVVEDILEEHYCENVKAALDLQDRRPDLMEVVTAVVEGPHGQEEVQYSKHAVDMRECVRELEGAFAKVPAAAGVKNRSNKAHNKRRNSFANDLHAVGEIVNAKAFDFQFKTSQQSKDVRRELRNLKAELKKLQETVNNDKFRGALPAAHKPTSAADGTSAADESPAAHKPTSAEGHAKRRMAGPVASAAASRKRLSEISDDPPAAAKHKKQKHAQVSASQID